MPRKQNNIEKFFFRSVCAVVNFYITRYRNQVDIMSCVKVSTITFSDEAVHVAVKTALLIKSCRTPKEAIKMVFSEDTSLKYSL